MCSAVRPSSGFLRALGGKLLLGEHTVAKLRFPNPNCQRTMLKDPGGALPKRDHTHLRDPGLSLGRGLPNRAKPVFGASHGLIPVSQSPCRFSHASYLQLN
jgi:hypothetical protein